MAYVSISNLQNVKSPATPSTTKDATGFNKGGVLGGIGYVGEKAAVGFMSSLEGIWDYSAGGLAKLFGADDWAERQFANDWFGDWYSHPDEWYNPGKGWQTAGDIAGGIGTSLPAMLAATGAVAIAAGTGGTGAPISAGILSAIGGSTAAVTAGLGAAGTATKQAYRETGKLTGKEFGYGALSGTVEGGMEGLTNALSLGTGAIIKNVAKSFAKETAKTVAKQSVFKTLAGSFIGEAFEEGMAEIIDPVLQRMTYNPEAQNATPQEVAYAAFVGGMSGLLMGGAGTVYDAGKNFQKGNEIVGKKQDSEVMGLSSQIAAFEKKNHTGDETYETVAETYDSLSKSLEATGGVVTTVTQKKLLGELERANTVAVFKPMIYRSAANIVNSANIIADHLNKYGYKTADGKQITVTAEQIRAGIDPNDVSSYAKALKENSILRELAVADATGHLVMDTARFTEATLMGERLASQAELNQFLETAPMQEKDAVAQALGFENVEALARTDYVTLNRLITRFAENGGVEQYMDRRAMAKAIQEIPAETARPMPKVVNLRQDGSVRYSDGDTDIAITKQGDAYTLYNYETNMLSKNMTKAEVNKILRDYNTQKVDADANAIEQARAEAETQQQAEAVEELDTYARENISDYSKLSAPNQGMIRKVLRDARANGITEAETLTFARVAARSGMNIVFDGAKSAVGDANIQGNTIYINPNAPKERLQSRLLLHEAGHALLRSKDGKNLIAEAFRHIAPERSQEIAQRYIKFYKKQGMSMEQYMPIVNEEITAAYIEDVLGDANAWEYILGEDPSLSEKVLSFFRKAARDYSADEKLSAEARKLLRTYKKLFADLSAQNQGNNALELSRQDERRKKAVTRTNDKNAQVTDNSPRITSGMSDDERYEVLKDKDITISAKTDRTKLESVMSKLDIIESDLDLSKYGDKKRLFKKLGEEFGVFRQYNNPDTSVKFSFSKGGMAESVSKQRKGYMRLAKLLTCIDGVIENAVGIESHNRNDEGYKVDTSLKNVYVLASAFVDGENIIPVKLEVKEFSDKENTLYVAIALESIKKNEIVKQEVATNGVARQYSPSFTISIADFLRKINPSDESFYKYIPKRLLEASKTEQYISPPSDAEAPNRTLDRELSLNTAPADSITDPEENVKKNPTDERHALPETDSEGNALSAGQREYFADSKVLDENGNLLLVYHRTRKADFTEFRRNVNYFTDSAEMADSYSPNGERYAGYLNITNPYIIDAGGEKWSRIPIDDETKQFLDERGSSTFEEDGAWRTTPADIAAAIEEAVDDGEMDYDGIIIRNVDDTGSYSKTGKSVVANDYITFRSNQFKNADNASPTTDKDIRYALPENIDDIEHRSIVAKEVSKSIKEEILTSRGENAKPAADGKGVRAKKNADHNHSKVYTKSDARDVIHDVMSEIPLIDGVFPASLLGTGRESAVEILWQDLNSTASGERGAKALELAEYILQNATLEQIEDSVGVEEMLERRNALRGYLHSFDLSSLKGDIKHAYGKRASEIYLLWSKKNGGVSPDAAVSELAEMGVQISSENPTDILFEIHDAYKKAGEYLRKQAKVYLEETLDARESEQIKQNIAKAILRGYDKTGSPSKLSKVINQYETELRNVKKKLEDAESLNSIRNKALDIMNRIGEITKGVFANASAYRDDIFKGSIGKLANLKYRGNLRNGDVIRGALKELNAWYSNAGNRLFFQEDGKHTNIYSADISDIMKYLSEREGELSAAELKMLIDVLEYFKKTSETFGKVFRGGKWVEAKPIAERYINIIENNKTLKVGLFNKLAGTAYSETFMEPMTVARRMDMYEDGAFFSDMMEDIRKGAENAQVSEMEIKTEYDEFLHKNKKYVEKATRETVELRGESIPRMNLIQLYMTTKRRQAWEALAYSGKKYTLPGNDSMIVEGTIPISQELTDEQLKSYVESLRADIEKLLTDTDKEYIKILESVYNGAARDMKSKRDIERLGYTNARSDYYIPIRRADIASSVDTENFFDEMRVSNASFNKDTVKGAKNRLLIESADVVFNRHIRGVCQYAHLSAPIENFDRLFNLDVSGNQNAPYSIAVASEDVWKSGKQYFQKLISDVQGISPKTEGMAALAFLRSGYAKYQLGANPKVWFTQLSSMFASSSILDADCITRGMFIKAEEVDKYSPLAKLRNNDNTAAMAQGVLDKNTVSRRFARSAGKLGDALMIPVGKMDRFVVCRLFGACQAQVEKNGGAKVGTETNKRAAGELLEKVILETQQNSIATERSKAMRSGNEFMRTITMFSADSMKTIGRVIDGMGEVSVLRAKLKAATDPKLKLELEARLKTANRKARKAIGALVTSAAYMVAVAELFRWLFDKETDEDETATERLVTNFAGNMLGGLPLFRDVYSYFIDGFGMENYAYSTLNDLLVSAKSVTDAATLLVSGDGTSQDIALSLRKMTYSAGQILGVPTRNLYNAVYGLTKRFSPQTAYKLDNVFYEKNYQTDLYRAIEEDDTEMIGMLMSMLWGERMGDTLNETVFDELYLLSQKGYKVMPRVIPVTLTVNDEEIALTTEQIQKIRESYAESLGHLTSLFEIEAYKTLSDEQKVEAIKQVYSICYDSAIESTLGIDKGKSVLIAKTIGADLLSIATVATKGIASDVDKNGDIVSGSKRKKVVSAINALSLSPDQKLLLICAKGYSLSDGDVRGLRAENAKKRLLRYILNLKNVTQEEKAELAKICGFEVKNGRIVAKTSLSAQ